MNKSDKLIENLVDYEIDMLGGQSDRVVLMGVSQGGAQSMLRFLRSRKRLGGWVGGVCHAPVAPHTPYELDPLLDESCPPVNRDRPLRFLAGGADVCFPPALVLRDAERLRKVGCFVDVQVEVQPGLTHEGYHWHETKRNKKNPPKYEDATLQRASEDVPDLLLLRRHLPSMLGLAPAPACQCWGRCEQCGTPVSCHPCGQSWVPTPCRQCWTPCTCVR